MVEVFKTQINDKTTAEAIIKKLQEHLPFSKINFDLEDCDRILRIEGEHVLSSEVIKLLSNWGHCCESLD